MSESDELIKKLKSEGLTEWQIRHELCAKEDHSICDPLGHRCPKAKCAQGDHTHCAPRHFQCPKILKERSTQSDYSSFDPAQIIQTLCTAMGSDDFSKYSIEELIGLSLPMMTKQDSSAMYRTLVEVLLNNVQGVREAKLISAIEHLNSNALPLVATGIKTNTAQIQALSQAITDFNNSNAQVLSSKLQKLLDTISTESQSAGSLTKWVIGTAIAACLINLAMCVFTAIMAEKTAEMATFTEQSVALTERQLLPTPQKPVFKSPIFMDLPILSSQGYGNRHWK